MQRCGHQLDSCDGSVPKGLDYLAPHFFGGTAALCGGAAGPHVALPSHLDDLLIPRASTTPDQGGGGGGGGQRGGFHRATIDR